MTQEEQLAIPPTGLEIAELLARATEVKWAARLGPVEVMLIRRLAFDRDRLEAKVDELKVELECLKNEKRDGTQSHRNVII